MFVLDSIACADKMPSDGSSGQAQIIAEAGSSGGYASVGGNDAYMQLAYSPFDGKGGVTGLLEWTPSVHVGIGNIILAAGTRGIRFCNYTPGSVAVISAGLSEPTEPPLQLTSAGTSTPGTAATLDVAQLTGQGLPVALGTGASTAIVLAAAYDFNNAPATYGARTAVSGVFVSKPGYYRFTGYVQIQASAAGTRYLAIRKNGAPTDSIAIVEAASPSLNWAGELDVTLSLAAGDFMELYAFQSSGGPLNIVDARMTMVKFA